jgi:tetratricopeptide (TPR) repeat protein
VSASALGRTLAARVAGAALLGSILAVAACTPPVRGVPSPDADEYERPTVAEGDLARAERTRFETAWRAVVFGDVPTAEREFVALLGRHPGSLAAGTGLAWTRLRAGRVPEARQQFTAVLAVHPDDPSALLGAAAAASRAGDADAAFGLYRRAQAVAPGNAIVLRHLPQVRLQVTEARVTAGRAALDAGRPDDALREYEAALAAAPELGALRLEIANVLVARGDVPRALDVLRGDKHGDLQVQLRLAEVLAGQGQYDQALETYRQVLARDAQNDEARRGIDAVRGQLELQGMPEEYRHILTAERLTRADLTALVAVKVTALRRATPGQPAVAVDISGSWARDHILKALAYNLIDVYPNHTFQPGAMVRRGDVARAVAGVLDALKWPQAPGPSISDMSRGNLLYYSASRATAAGIMDLNAAGAFEPWKPVSGEDAVRVIDALARLVGP